MSILLEKETKKQYPLYSTIRVKKSTLARLQKHGASGTSIDSVLVSLLDQIEGVSK